MSDKIKTQHGTIGLLMAECEQLRRELAQAKAEKSEVVRGFDLVQGLYRGVKEAIAAQGEEIDRLQGENARLAAACIQSDEVIDELSHHWSTHRNEFDRFDIAQRRITALREGRGNALRDLLAPTIALEERFSTVRAGHLPECPCERCMLARELIRDAARLRSILTSGAKSDTNTP